MSVEISAWGKSKTAFALDLFERAAVVSLYIWLVYRLFVSIRSGGQVADGLLMISEGLVIVFLLTRKATTEISRRPADWLLAFGATVGPLLVNPGRGEPLVPPPWAATIWLFGTILQVSAKIALGRSFGCVPANRGLKSAGPYRWVRHPMYLGYMIGHVAFLLMNPTPFNLMIYLICDGVQIPRIRAEERFLARDPMYLTYEKAVPWRVIPGIF